MLKDDGFTCVATLEGEVPVVSQPLQVTWTTVRFCQPQRLRGLKEKDKASYHCISSQDAVKYKPSQQRCLLLKDQHPHPKKPTRPALGVKDFAVHNGGIESSENKRHPCWTNMWKAIRPFIMNLDDRDK
ncbi:hypothetical protein RRG08_000722 [Elysia crispata]|uniref:Uncharacterized protein n=1 Tax=Elysia crispata TaxID=231223 RepID=A0AAE1AY30_9GAST|nr:hypothetical protein RRG08_000722 [Elysia crispata]